MRVLFVVFVCVLSVGGCTEIPAVDGVRYACSASAPCGAGFECQAGVCVARGATSDADTSVVDSTSATDTALVTDVPTGTTDTATSDADVAEVVTCVPETELCNGLDEDCDGDSDETFGLGTGCDGADADDCANGVLVCDPLDPSRAICDESGAAAASERCDGLDNDCDGDTDEGFDLGATCTVGVGVCAADGVVVCATPTTTGCGGDGQPTTTTCDDGDACTADDRCTGGPGSTCAGTAYACPGACRSCDGAGGCTVAPATCYIDGVCYSAASVNPTNPCEQCRYGQNPVGWSAYDGGPCDDLDACTAGDTCLARACQPGDPRDDDDDGHVDGACGGDDCDDADATVYPGASERCDGVANDCGAPDALEPCVDGDGDGWCAAATAPQGDGAPCPLGGGDCNDANFYATPESTYPCATITNPIGLRTGVMSTLFVTAGGEVQALSVQSGLGRLRRLGFSGLTVASDEPVGGVAHPSPIAVALGSADRVYFAYYVDQVGGALRVGRLAGSTLVAERTFGRPSTASASPQSAPGIAVAPDGAVVVAHRDQDTLAVRRLTPSLRVVSRELVPMATAYEHVVTGGLWVGSDGQVRVLSYDAVTLVHRVHTRASDGTWSISTSPVGDRSAQDATWDAAGNVHACAPANDGSAVTYLTRSAGSWARTALPSSAVAYSSCRIELTASATHIVFGSDGNALNHSRKLSASSWTTGTIPQLTAGDSLTTTVDGSGNLWLLRGQSYLAKFGAGWQVSARLDPDPCSFGAIYGTTGGKSLLASDGSVHSLFSGSSTPLCHVRDGAFVERLTALPTPLGYYDAIALEDAGTGKLALAYAGLGVGIEGPIVQAQRQGGTWSLVGSLSVPAGTSPLTVDSALTPAGAYYVVYSTRFPYVVRMAKSSGVGTPLATDATWTPLAVDTASWPDLALFADPTPRLAVCSAAGVHLYTSSGSGWSDAIVSAKGCLRLRAWSDGGALTLAWLDTDYARSYAFVSGGVWETYAVPDDGNNESVVGLAAMPGPTTLFATNVMLGVPAIGAFDAPERIAPSFSCSYPQPFETPSGLVVSCGLNGTLVTLEP